MKIAFTGSHGCGKTTAVYNTAYEYKLKNNSRTINLLTEVARYSPFPLNKNTTLESEQWIYYKQLVRELEEESICDILICDRTIVDVLAYSKVAGFDKLVEVLIPISEYHLKTYDEIYFLSIENNNYHFADGIRDLDLDFRKKIEDVLLDFYKILSKNITDWDRRFIIK
jgi:hypothetical protein